MDLHSALDAGLERRLENWGRWAAPRRVLGTSPLYQLIVENNPGTNCEAPDDRQLPVDEADAMIIDRAIVMSCREYEKSILRKLFISHLTPSAVCSRAGVSRRCLPAVLAGIGRKVSSCIQNENAYNGDTT